MAFKLDDIGKVCPFCNEAKLVQYRSGKIGCGAYCWNKEGKVAPTNKKVEAVKELDQFTEIMAKLDTIINLLTAQKIEK